MLGAAIVGGSALLGGLAGAMGSKQTSSRGLSLSAPTELERRSRDLSTGQVNNLGLFAGSLGNQQDIFAGQQSLRDLGALFGQYASGGFLPSSADMFQAQNITSDLFAPQREQLRQSFIDQTIQSNRVAGGLGRSINDPILQSRLRQSMFNQQSSLAAEQQAASRQLAMNLPMQRLGFAQQQAQTLSGLGGNVLSGNMNILQSLQGVLGAERNFRLGTATQNYTQSTPGGFKGFLSGALGGAGAGLGALGGIQGMGNLSGMFGGGGTGGGTPYTPNAGNYSFGNYTF